MWTTQNLKYRTGTIFPTCLSYKHLPSPALAKQSSTPMRAIVLPCFCGKGVRRHRGSMKSGTKPAFTWSVRFRLRSWQHIYNNKDNTTPSRTALGSPPGCVKGSVSVLHGKGHGATWKSNCACSYPHGVMCPWGLYKHHRYRSLRGS